MRAETHRIFARAGDGDPGAALVRSAGEAGCVHLGAGHFAMQDMRVLRRRDAVAQQAGVIGETAIGLDDDLGRTRLLEHALHGEFDAVEDRAPDDLAHIGQDHDMAARVRQADRLDAGVVAEQARRQPGVAQGDALLFAEEAALQRDGRVIEVPPHSAFLRGNCYNRNIDVLIFTIRLDKVKIAYGAIAGK